MKGNMDQQTKDTMLDGLRKRSADQTYGAFFRPFNKGCAVGVMAEALGFDRNTYRCGSNKATENPAVFLAATTGVTMTFWQRVVDRNDGSRWTFHRIASWLEREIKVQPHLTDGLIEAARTAELQQIEDYANSQALVH